MYLKNTGGYKLEILYALCGLNIAVHIELIQRKFALILVKIFAVSHISQGVERFFLMLKSSH
jgi:hypothetical protein